MGRHGGPRRALAYLAVARAHMLDDDELRSHVRSVTSLDDVDGPVHPRPVVLVHGWLARKTSWQRTIVRLHRAGFVDMHTAAYDVFRHDLHGAARIVAGRIRDVAEQHGTPVDVVGHSMGGIATLEALVDHGVTDRVATVTSLGSPYHGAPLARAARLLPAGPLRAARQLRPGSPDLARLRDAAADGIPVAWTSLWSPADELVPAESARLTAPGAQAVETPPVGHVELLLSRTVVAQVADTLRSQAPVAA